MRSPDSSLTIMGPRQKKTVWRYGSASHWQWKNDANQCCPCMFPVTLFSFLFRLSARCLKMKFFLAEIPKIIIQVFSMEKKVFHEFFAVQDSPSEPDLEVGRWLGGWSHQQAAWVFLIDIFLPKFPIFLEHGGQWQFCWRWSIFVHWSNMKFTRPFAPEISWFQATVAPLRGCKPTRKMTELFPRNSRKIGGNAQNFTVSISALTCWMGVTSNS